MARHAEDALGGASIAQVLDLALAVAASEAIRTEGLVPRQNGEILNLIAAVVAAVGAVVADQRAVSEQQQVGVRVEQRAARVAAEAVNVPSVASCADNISRSEGRRVGSCGKAIPSSNALPSSRISPQPLHGYTTSSWSMGDSG